MSNPEQQLSHYPEPGPLPIDNLDEVIHGYEADNARIRDLIAQSEVATDALYNINEIAKIPPQPLSEIEKRQIVAWKQQIDADQYVLNPRYYVLRDQAVERLLHADRGFLATKALQYRESGVSVVTLFIAGQASYVKALGKFDFSRPNNVLTYVGNPVRRDIQRAYQLEAGQVRLPANIYTDMGRVKTFIHSYRTSHKGNAPTIAQVAVGLKMKDSKIEELLSYINASTNHGHSGGMPERNPEDFAETTARVVEATERTAKIVQVMPGQLAYALIHSQGLLGLPEKTPKELAREWNTTERRAKEIIAEAIHFFRQEARARGYLIEE